MALTSLAIVQSALYDIGKVPPASIVSSTVTEQLRLKNLLYAEARYLRNLSKWPQQKKKFSFTLTASRVKYPLPEDFYDFAFDTSWNETQQWRTIGSATDSEFTARLYGIGTSDAQIVFRIFGPDGNVLAGVGGQFYIDPVPTATDTLSFEYYSKNLFLPPNWTASETGITASPAEYRNANGNNYKCTAITTGTCGTTAPSHTTGSAVDGGVTWTYYSTPYESIIVDEDLCMFDDDLVICGLKWRYLKSIGENFEPERGEYARLLKGAMARFQMPKMGTFSRFGMGRISPRGDRDGGYFL